MADSNSDDDGVSCTYGSAEQAAEARAMVPQWIQRWIVLIDPLTNTHSHTHSSLLNTTTVDRIQERHDWWSRCQQRGRAAV